MISELIFTSIFFFAFLLSKRKEEYWVKVLRFQLKKSWGLIREHWTTLTTHLIHFDLTRRIEKQCTITYFINFLNIFTFLIDSIS